MLPSKIGVGGNDMMAFGNDDVIATRKLILESKS